MSEKIRNRACHHLSNSVYTSAMAADWVRLWAGVQLSAFGCQHTDAESQRKFALDSIFMLRADMVRRLEKVEG